MELPLRNALGRTICETRLGFRGALLVTANEYNTANQLIATRTFAIEQSEQSNNPNNSASTPLTFTYFCYNSLGERNLTVFDMNLNNQIDWSDTDRIVSNDTRYVSFNGERQTTIAYDSFGRIATMQVSTPEEENHHSTTTTFNYNSFGSYYFGSDLFGNTATGGLANLETYATLSQTAANGEEAEDIVSTETNQVYLAQSPETFAYAYDGNQTLIMTMTGLWRVSYNGENRPILWENLAAESDNQTISNQTILLMAYDHMGRRRAKNAQRYLLRGPPWRLDRCGSKLVE